MVAPGTRVLGVCADDIGLVAGAAETALELAAAGRLTAASCVTTTPLWSRDAQRLNTGSGGARASGLALGLHFNLSEGEPLSAALRKHWPRFPALSRLIIAAHLGALPRAAIGEEWGAQLAAFTDALGRTPDFIDGHQHVHHLPGVREIVLDGATSIAPRPAIRNTGHLLGPGSTVKLRIIEATGGRALQRALRARGLRHNSALLGAYDFADADYGSLVRAWLASVPAHGGLLFCHPCLRPPEGESIAPARRREAEYLGSERFAADLAAAGVSLGPAWPARESSSAG